MQIDLFHDTACPWRRIGKRHWQLALAQWDGAPVQVRYRTFFLNERIPPAGEAFKPYMNAVNADHHQNQRCETGSSPT